MVTKVVVEFDEVVKSKVMGVGKVLLMVMEVRVRVVGLPDIARLLMAVLCLSMGAFACASKRCTTSVNCSRLANMSETRLLSKIYNAVV